jgi:tetratricopeptide (TPR) repeat protein
MRRVLLPFTCACLLTIGLAHAQQKSPTQAAAALVASGKYEDALAAIQKTLAMAPTNREATMVKIDALVGLEKSADALDTYYAFVAAAKERQDANLAWHLGRASLRHAAAGDHPDAQSAAAELLRAAGETAAAPKQTAAGAGAAKAGTTQAGTAKTGAPRPEETLANASAPVDARRAALDRLTAPVSQETQQHVRAALKATEPGLKLSAATAVSRLELRSAIPELRLLLKDAFLPVKLTAAAALRELGDSGGNETLFAALKAEFLAGRLLAARALSATGDTSWPPQIAPLLESPRANERVAAAELLLKTPAHAEKAREILKTEISGDQPALRGEAIRVLASQADADPWSYLPLMRDANPVVRVYAAGVLMRKLAPAPAAAAGRSPR